MSQKQLAKYVIALEAQTARYQKGLEDAQRKLGRFKKKQQVDIKKIAKGFAAVAAAVKVAGLAIAAYARQGINVADQSIKTARTLGLTAAQYESLAFAAQQAGVSAGTLDSSLQSFVRRLGEATQGGGQASAALSRLGLDARQLAALPTDVAMGKVADALDGVDGSAQRAQLAYQIFGRQGIELTRMLEGGSAALEDYRKESERFGVTLTATQVRNVEDATDAQGRLSTATRGLSMQLGSTLAPAFTNAANAAANFLARITESVPRVAALTSQILGLQRNLNNLTLRDVEEEMRLIERRSVQLAEAYALVSRRSRTLRDGTETEARQLARLRGEIEQNQQAYEALGRRMEELRRNGDKQEASAGAEAMALGAGGRLGAIGLSDSMQDAIRELDAARREADGIFNRTRTDVERYVADIQRAQQLLVRGLIDQETFDRWVTLHAEAFEKIKEEADSSYGQISEFANQAARNLQDAFADFLFDPFKDGLSGMLRGFRDTLRRMVAEAASQQILGALFGGLAGSSNAFLSALGGAFGGARAMGGPVSSGKAYLVGERGPELFVPGSSGQIVPNGATSVTVNIDARQSDDPGRILSLVPLIQNQIEQSMELKMRRGLI